MSLISATKTQAVLIGVSDYSNDETLHNLPAAKANIEKLKSTLSSDTVGIAQGNITSLTNPKTSQEVLKAIKTAAQNASLSLLIYYSGHGVLDENFDIYLTTSETKVDDISFTGVSIEALGRVIQKEKLQVILILDACFSEKAFEQFRKTNFYVLASSRKNTPSKYPPEELYSAFTNEFVRVLEKGVDIRKTDLTLRDIYLQLNANLTKKDFPEPRQMNSNLIQEKKFAKNNATSVSSSTLLNREIILPIYYAIARYRNLPTNKGIINNDFSDIENPFEEDELSEYFEEHDNDQNYQDNLLLSQYANQIIRFLPLFIAEELKRLFVPSLQEQERNIERINQIMKIYFSSMRYLTYVLLAQLWDERIENPVVLSDKFKELFSKIKNHQHTLYFSLTVEIISLFTSQNRKIFIQELVEWKTQLNQPRYQSAYKFFEDLYRNIRSHARDWDKSKMEEVCLEAEQHLTTVIEQLAFLSKYELISIRNIRVIKDKNTKARFVHRLNHLHADTNHSSRLETEINDFYTDSHSLCLTKATNLTGKLLNLMPLLVDKNSYTQSIPNLFFFEREDSTNEGYAFRSVTFSRENSAETLAYPRKNVELLNLMERFFTDLGLYD